MRLSPLALIALLLATPACGQAPPARQPAAERATPPAIEAAYRRALELSPLPHEVEQAHRYWTTAPSSERGDESFYLDRLQRRILQDERARAASPTPASLSQTCVDIVLKSCAVIAAGMLNAGEETLWFQLQDGFTDEDGVGGGVVVFRAEGARLRPLVWSFEGSRYDAPMIADRGEGRMLLVAPGLSRGTGSGDMRLMVLWRDGAWRPVDTDWQSRAQGLLNGLEVRHRPYWDFPDLRAWSPLWKASDANCCGSQGSAILEFNIVDDRLTLTEVRRIADTQ